MKSNLMKNKHYRIPNGLFLQVIAEDSLVFNPENKSHCIQMNKGTTIVSTDETNYYVIHWIYDKLDVS